MLQTIFSGSPAVAILVCSILAGGCAAPVVQPVQPDNLQAEVSTQSVETELELALQNWFVEARNAVDKRMKTDLSGVTLQITDTQGIAVHAKTSLMHALEYDLDNKLFAESLVNNILTLQTESVLAIYAPSVKQILLHDSNLEKYLKNLKTNKKQALQALLVHELIHAADDQKHNAFKHLNVISGSVCKICSR